MLLNIEVKVEKIIYIILIIIVKKKLQYVIKTFNSISIQFNKL